MRDPDKPQQIIEAAVRVFARKGYYNSRVSDIAREAGIAAGTIYLYVRTKDDILVTLFRDKMAQFVGSLRKAIADEPDAVAKLSRLIRLHFEMLEEDLRPREQRVEDLVKKPLTKEQFDAQVLMHYQSGNRYLPAVAALINAGEVEVLEKLWTLMAYDANNKLSRGLEIRRAREKEIFFHGDYGPVEAPIKVWKGNPRKTAPMAYHIKDSDLAGL